MCKKNHIQRALMATRAAQQAQRDAQQPLGRQKRAKDEHRARLQDWVDSGDPVLRAEALRQLSRLEDSG